RSPRLLRCAQTAPAVGPYQEPSPAPEVTHCGGCSIGLRSSPTQRGDLLTGRADVELPDLLAEVNARISEYAESADVGGVTWEFVCECGAVECQERISLSLVAFAELR